MHAFSTLNELIESTFEKYGSELAYSCMGHSITYDELDDLSHHFASYLIHELGLSKGDKIAIQLPNVLQFPIAFLGAVRAGLVVVSSNPLYTSREIKHQLVDSEAKALIVLSNVAENASKIIGDTQVQHVIVTNVGDVHPFPKKQIINFVVKHIKKMVPKFHFKSHINFVDIFKTKRQALPTIDVTPEDLAVLQYTGGTTGVSKGAMLSHHNFQLHIMKFI